MISPQVSYIAPADVATACEVLASRDGAVAMGGGTILVPELVRRERDVSAIVELRGLGLDAVTSSADAVHIGAMVDYAHAGRDALVGQVIPMIAAMSRGITGGAQLRNQATLGGSACRAMPSSDVPTTLLALGATMRAQGPRASRDVAAADFFIDAARTVLERDEILTAISVPRGEPGQRQGYVKFKLCESSWPLITAGAVVTAGVDGQRVAVIGVGGLAPTPVRIEFGFGPSRPSARDLDDLLAEQAPVLWSDELGDGAYRASIAGVIARRSLDSALAHSEEGTTR